MSTPVRDHTLAPTHAAPTRAVSAASPVRRVVWLVGLSHFTNHFVMLIFPAVLLLVQREYHLGYFGLGLFANVALLFYGVGALPAGILTDRLGGDRLLAVWLLGGSLVCIGIGVSTGPVGLVMGLAALGLFGSLALLFGGLGHLVAGRLMAPRHREVIFAAITGVTAISLFGMGITTGLALVLFSIALGAVAVGATALVFWFGHITAALAPGNFKPKTDNVSPEGFA